MIIELILDWKNWKRQNSEFFRTLFFCWGFSWYYI